MFHVLAFLSLPQRFDCEGFAVLCHMRHSRRQDTSTRSFAPVAMWRAISITPVFIWPDFSQEELTRRNSAATTFASFSTRRYLETLGAGVKAYQGWL